MTVIHESFASAASATCNKPAGAAVDDVLVAVVLAQHSAAAAIPDFTVVGSADLAGAYRLTLLTKVVTGSEGASFTATGGTVLVTGISRFSGVDTANVTNGTATSAAGAGTTVTAGAVTTTAHGSMLVLGGGGIGAGVSALTTDGNLLERWDQAGASSRGNLGTGYKVSAGPSDTGTVTATGASYTLACMIALTPAVVEEIVTTTSGLLLPL